jgi:hypothetical protein
MAAGNAVSCATGDKEGAGVRRQETSRGMEAGRRTGPRRRVAVPAPEEKQGLRGEPDDGVAADRVACPAGGEWRVSRDRAIETCSSVSAGMAPRSKPPSDLVPSPRQFIGRVLQDVRLFAAWLNRGRGRLLLLRGWGNVR